MCAKAAGVQLQEIDQSTIVRGGSTSVGALVLWSKKGPLEERVLIGSTKEFRKVFGDEEPGLYGHYTALAFLRDGQRLYCYRTADSTDKPNYGGVLFMDEASSDPNEALATGVPDPDSYSFSGDEVLLLTGANPGAWNNDLKVTLEHDATDAEVFVVKIFAPDEEGNYSQVEKDYSCSRKPLKKDGFGKSMYVEDVLNDVSEYIRVKDNTAVSDDVLPKEQSSELQFASGDDGSEPSAADVAQAWEDAFLNKRAVSVNILMAGGWDDDVVTQKLDEIAGSRQDCTYIADPENTTSTSTAIANRNALSLVNPSYGALYFPWVKDEDEVNDKTLEMPPSGYAGGVYARNDDERNVWDPPFGQEIGVLAVSGLTVDLSDAEIEELSAAQINPIVQFPGVGFVIWGGRTLQSYESARSWINVRRLLNRDEQANLNFLQTFIGKNNTAFTRLQIQQALESYYEPLIGDAYYDVQPVCDSSNNPSSVIDAGELVVDVYVQPVKPINRIKLRVTITRTGVSLQEIASGAVAA